MTTTPVSISEYNRRTISIEVTGMCHQNVRRSHYTVKVPYSSLAKTLQSIQRAGGTVGKVTGAAPMSTSVPITPATPVPPMVSPPYVTVATLIAPIPVPTVAKKSADTAGKPFKTSNTRSTKQKRR